MFVRRTSHRRPRWTAAPWLLLYAAIAHAAVAEEVVRVKDGDSLVVLSRGAEVDVRLADIDAPEYDQPHGTAARAALGKMVRGRDVELALVGGDTYGRIVARVYVGALDVNAEMARLGYAWVRRAYNPAPELVLAEEAARKARVGLWRDDDPLPPWIWRRMKRSTADTKPTPAEPTKEPPRTFPDVACDTKQYCKQMTSCEEAFAFLHQCNLTSLDQDGDGIPCESLCRYLR